MKKLISRRAFGKISFLTASALLLPVISKERVNKKDIPVMIDAKDLKKYIGHFLIIYTPEKTAIQLKSVKNGTIESTQVSGGKHQGEFIKFRYNLLDVGIKIWKSPQGVLKEYLIKDIIL